ncbi:serine-type D-Ala-D-Ala carboxypeptidase [Vallitalea longa]|uniref:serine-type D-Ala-D-Ala carboxypeptidase n=2 Tax=Vallitalea longa TaxID=2936439 RepID=A0A9W6DG41_9FIRM|nr:serine-type D-Ala-D-Ala carboxypeptidase [Vallitalea longa]
MMKKITSIVAYIFIVIIIFSSNMVSAKESNKEPEKLYAYSALLMDKKTGRVLWEKKGFEERAMASTTKIMTCIMALESCELDEIVEVSEKASKAPKVKLYIRPGEQYYLGDLLHALMLVSSNDVAIAVAEHVAGSTEKFCKLMTAKAKEIGAINTCYITPNGLDAEGHHTTAYDLALVTRYALNNEMFNKIINTPSKSFCEIKEGRNFNINNKNSFLNMYDGANGVKTGFTSKAGYCFVGSAKQEDLELISVVLASGWPNNKTYKWSDTKKIMNYGFDNFETRTVLTSNKHVCQIGVDKGIIKDIDVLTSDNVEITLSDDETVDILYNVEPNLIAPIEIGQNVGEAAIYVDGKFYYSVPLISNTEVEKITYKYIFNKVLDKFLLFSN